MRTVTANGQAFVLSDSGEGPLVVLLHGFPDTPAGWSDTCAVLNGAGYRTIAPYLRAYHPDTLVPGRGYSGPEIGEDVVRLLDAIDVDRAVLVGHDWGAAIAYRAAAMAPERVSAVCGVAIPHPSLLKPSPALAWRARHFVTLSLPTGRWLASRHDLAYIDTLIRRWAPNWSGPERDACLRDAKKAFADPRVLDAALAYYREVSRSEKAPRLSQPALIVGGRSDIIDEEAFARSPEAFDGPCGVLMLDGAGHWPHREARGAFDRRLLSFLADLPDMDARSAVTT